MAKRVSALSQVLKEKQTEAGITPAPEPEPETPRNNVPALPQNDNISKQENDNTVKPQIHSMRTKTQERDKVTYYLEPGQFDKLEEIRLAYKKATGTRLNEQELMRLIIDRLHLDFLL